MPILGTIASQVPGRLSQWTESDYESIATATPNGTSVTFSSIPNTYKHLQIRAISRTSRNDAYVDGMYLRFNGSSSAYSWHWLNGTGSATGVLGYPNETNIVASYWGADAQTIANVFSASIWDILDYASTTKTKTTKCFFTYDSNDAGNVTFTTGNWRNTSAVTSITLFAEGTFTAGTHIALYGIKG
jgi:hypothetical protein